MTALAIDLHTLGADLDAFLTSKLEDYLCGLADHQNAAQQQRKREQRLIRDDHKHRRYAEVGLSGATDETKRQLPKAGPGGLIAMLERKELTIEQVSAALDIEMIYRGITGAVRYRGMSFETRIDRSPVGDIWEEPIGLVRLHRIYTEWRDKCMEIGWVRNRWGAIMEFLTEDSDIDAVAGRWGVGKRSLANQVRRALDQFLALRRPKGRKNFLHKHEKNTKNLEFAPIDDIPLVSYGKFQKEPWNGRVDRAP